MFQSKTIEQRLLNKVTKTESCWLWNGAKSNTGYGVIGDKLKLYPVHRVAYMLWNGAIPAGLHIDHLCSVRLCVNPQHLQAVTQGENNRRSNAIRWAKVTHCKRGHEFTEANTMRQHGGKYRMCRECHNMRNRKEI